MGFCRCQIRPTGLGLVPVAQQRCEVKHFLLHLILKKRVLSILIKKKKVYATFQPIWIVSKLQLPLFQLTDMTGGHTQRSILTILSAQST